MSGNEEQVKKHGNWFTHDKCPRALMFKRDQHKVNSMETLMKLMRYSYCLNYSSRISLINLYGLNCMYMDV